MLAEYALIPTRFAHYVPTAVGVDAAALVEPGANALRAVRASGAGTGDRLLIMGDGTIGLLATLFAVDAGAEVTVSGLRPDRLALAGRLGARHTLTAEAVSGLPPRSFDAVLDATTRDLVGLPCLGRHSARVRRRPGPHPGDRRGDRPGRGARPAGRSHVRCCRTEDAGRAAQRSSWGTRFRVIGCQSHFSGVES